MAYPKDTKYRGKVFKFLEVNTNGKNDGTTF